GVEYLDKGTDTFTVRRFNLRTEAWEDLGTVRKTDSGEWKTAAFAAPGRWLERIEAGNEDFYGEIALDDNGDGTEEVRLFDMNIVDLSGYKTETLLKRAPADSFTQLDAPLTVDFSTSLPVNRIELPLYADRSFRRNGVNVKLFGLRDGNAELITEKSFFIFSDKDVMEINDPGETGFEDYRIEMTGLQGTVGWYQDAEGRPALEVSTFVSEDMRFTAEVKASGSELTGDFRADLPFSAVKTVVKGRPSGTASLYRNLPGTGWSDAVAVASLSSMDTENGKIFFPPQPAGKYRLVIRDSTGSTWSGAAARAEAAALPMVRRFEPKKASPLRIGEIVTAWDESRIARSWTGENALLRGNRISLDGANASLISPGGLGIEAGRNQYIELSLQNTTATGLLRVFWAEGTDPFSAEKSVYIPVVGNDEELRDYAFPVSLTDTWTGNIDRIKVELAQGSLDTGTLRLTRFEITDKTVLLDRDCSSISNALFPGTGMKDLSVVDGKLVIDQPYAVAETRNYHANFEAEKGQKVIISLINETNTTDFDLIWTTYDFDEAGKRVGGRGTVMVSMEAGSPDIQTFEIPVAENGDWKTTISSISLAFFHEEGRILLDEIKVIKE
ncbi:MAG: hypothetical protein PQJ58_16890, partial [Spirochaetales bacterium]|nr:hypothetical protein [Spirochaetales bacterium]